MSAEVVRLARSPGQERLLLKDEAYSRIRTLLLQGDSEQTYSERASRRRSI